MINIYNKDCLKAMKEMSDNEFDLAIVDPPYGIGDKFKGGKSAKMNFNEVVNKGWDIKPPSRDYFIELKRISKNQIIWGSNYFDLPPTQGFLIWNKKQPHDFSLAMCEYAWSSIQKPAKMWSLSVLKERGKIHPTQKPVELYEWMLINNAKEGNKILDTHLGSGSIAIACHNLGYDLEGYELDKDYYEAASKRLKDHQSQIRMF